MSDQVNYNPDDYIDDENPHNTKEKDNANWWPLLLIPLAFFIGWGVNEARYTTNQAFQNTAETGIGGGPNVPCTNNNVDQ